MPFDYKRRNAFLPSPNLFPRYNKSSNRVINPPLLSCPDVDRIKPKDKELETRILLQMNILLVMMGQEMKRKLWFPTSHRTTADSSTIAPPSSPSTFALFALRHLSPGPVDNDR